MKQLVHDAKWVRATGHTRVMRLQQANRRHAKAVRLDRQNEAAIPAAYLFLIAGLLISQLLLLISP
jgi:hypothetical protein